MIKNKEAINIILVSVILAFSITLIETITYFLYTLSAIFLIILINSIVKKITAYYLESEIKIKLWEFKRYGYKKRQKFKRPFPAGAFFPIIFRILFLPLNGFTWMSSLIFDVKAKTYRAAKRHGHYSFSEINESHIGLIAALGILANLIFGSLAYFLGFPIFTKLSIWYCFFNLIPLSSLDGNKIFFGKNVLWIILSVITLIGLIYTIIL